MLPGVPPRRWEERGTLPAASSGAGDGAGSVADGFVQGGGRRKGRFLRLHPGRWTAEGTLLGAMSRDAAVTGGETGCALVGNDGARKVASELGGIDPIWMLRMRRSLTTEVGGCCSRSRTRQARKVLATGRAPRGPGVGRAGKLATPRSRVNAAPCVRLASFRRRFLDVPSGRQAGPGRA